MNLGRTLAILLVAALAASCGGPEDQTQNSPSKGSRTTANPQAVPENSSSMNPTKMPTVPPGAPHNWRVELTEYHIQFPSPFPSGPQALQIVNAGKDTHGLVIVVDGKDQLLANDLTRGDSTTVNVDLRPGSYTVYCPMDGHKGKGMSTTIEVK